MKLKQLSKVLKSWAVLIVLNKKHQVIKKYSSITEEELYNKAMQIYGNCKVTYLCTENGLVYIHIETRKDKAKKMKTWEVTLNGNHLFFFMTKGKKIDMGTLFSILQRDFTNKKADYAPHKLMLREVKGYDDMGCIDLQETWRDGQS